MFIDNAMGNWGGYFNIQTGFFTQEGLGFPFARPFVCLYVGLLTGSYDN